MPRQRQLMTAAGDQFDATGQDWEADNVVDVSGGSVTIPYGTTTLIIRQDGSATLAEGQTSPEDHPLEANFFLGVGLDFTSEVRYSYGFVDHEADGSGEYSRDEQVRVLRVTWETVDGYEVQLQLDPTTFSLVDVSVTDPEAETGQVGFQIYKLAHIGGTDPPHPLPFEFDAGTQDMPDFFFWTGLGGGYNGADQADDFGGTSFDGIYSPDGGRDVMLGEGGDDILRGLSGPDLLRGAAGNDLLLGGSDNDTLEGGAGNDFLDGGTETDTMRGGSGDDIYVVDRAGDQVIEAAGEGIDTVETGVAHTLAAEVENLTLVGVSAVTGTGNSLNNRLAGNGAANQLSGGAGDDLYIVGAGDTVIENAGAGIDIVEAAVSWTLSANVENLTLVGPAALAGTGNALDNIITGNTLANTLTGGAGADTLIGAAGDDRYEVDEQDIIVEAAGGGTDTALSTGTYTLGDNVENLTLLGSAQIDGFGNGLDNVISGNSGANSLHGWLGDDRYVIGSLDQVVESADAGTDTVESSGAASYTLPDNVENLILGDTGNGFGNALDNMITGNAGDNELAGAAGSDVLDGGAGDDRLDGGIDADTMIGGAGNDVYVRDNDGDQVVENATGGIDVVHSSVSYRLPVNLENLVLTGAGAIDGAGNDHNNRLTGNDAANRLDGAAGADIMVGGGGDDVYVRNNAGDQIVELAGGGIDTVYSLHSYGLGASLDNLVLTGISAVNAYGNGLDNTLVGNGAANILNGGAGADIMIGGGGDDIYVRDNAGDQIGESTGAGIDTVHSALSYGLAANLENLILTGPAAINGYGNGLDNRITGNGAANILNGGAGADIMIGGGGDDLYVRDNGGDQIAESVGGGIDTVHSALSYGLGANVENLVLTGAAAIGGYGNALDNRITGNSAANTLNGGLGADVMIGGGGNDLYVRDDAGDQIAENAGGGIDSVHSSLGYGLGANVENLVLTGNAAIGGFGNELDNRITGNSAANTLNGGLGADVMIGGGGDDFYVRDNAGDQVSEAPGGGIDTVHSALSYGLGANVENLFLTGFAAIDGSGNALANSITGNAAANVLSGAAGNDTVNGAGGNDRIFGGGGNDLLIGGGGGAGFYFDTALNAATNVDDILDFSIAENGIFLDRSIFSGIGADGTLAASAFRTGTAAQDADDRILLDQATGRIFYDADGTGAGAAILFATVDPGLALTSADFIAYS